MLVADRISTWQYPGMLNIIKAIVGGGVVLVIGGTAFNISQTDVADNFAEETGLSHREAQQYIEDSQGELVSFTVLGEDLIGDGEDVMSESRKIDCTNYEYEWESNFLSCQTGKRQLSTFASDEIQLGNCYKSLEKDLGSAATRKIQECIDNIDALNDSYDEPIVTSILTASERTDAKQSNLYNKSVLRAALESKE